MSKIRLGYLFLIASFVSFSTLAEKTALVGGRLIDGFGNQPIANSVILIENGIIQQVGTIESLDVPSSFKIISTEGMDVLPGLWENHAHLMLNGHSDYVHWDKTYLNRLSDEIMPASALQLLLAGVTSARDLGAPLADTVSIKNRINNGDIPGPNLYVSGPFLQHEAYSGAKAFRWGINGVSDAKRKVNKLADAGMDIVKLIDQDKMTLKEAQAIVEQAHKRGLKVVAHSHRPDEIRRGLEIGVDNFEHTGLTTAPEYPEDIVKMLKERTATGRVAGGPLFWTPTVEGLWNYQQTVANPEKLDSKCWQRGLKSDTISDIQNSLKNVGQLEYMQLTPLRKPTLKRKIAQLKDAGVVFLIGTDSGIPTKFHCQSTWNEMAVWVEQMDISAMDTIRAATYWPAVMMGVSKKTGTVSVGKTADIIAVKGDVLRYINLLQNVDFVMKSGIIYKEQGLPVETNL
ncbi:MULTISPECIES: amidohydrolase family protein [unclassified Pseudoalteromonas]|uniref:amidohydrolase family protein n=1 Tax=unclassified Pseudoalteromonas TaxID=194690 RepID=UPI000CC95FAA|nr:MULTISPECIES: amidohydrolase family protein [unclassified Pseudoalteromonas]MBH0047749.1 amidohydrolase family protein [Pseudoalteromonas sp. NZS11_1]PLT26295.1 Xaa-Pro dipeptidase [Pseudoalteromonas sp. MelDa3]